ncbi:MAG: hypothetical protein HKL89_07900 [Candidatus Dormibacteraeota bacterium]|nr:hypothetical protein [Candidatus Dormibacteraeota bacterium]
MAVQRPRRGDDLLRYRSQEGDFEVEVSHTLNKWCVSVLRLADSSIVAQDFYPERWKAMARAQDFLRILNMRNRPGHEEGGDEHQEGHEGARGPGL